MTEHGTACQPRASETVRAAQRPKDRLLLGGEAYGLPPGIGALWARPGIVALSLSRDGGTQVLDIAFRDAAALADWQGSDLRERLRAGTAAPPPRQAPFWKRWMVSMVAVYPALVGLVYLTRIVTEGLPVQLSLFIVAFLLTGLSTGLFLPFLNRRLRGWLSR